MSTLAGGAINSRGSTLCLVLLLAQGLAPTTAFAQSPPSAPTPAEVAREMRLYGRPERAQAALTLAWRSLPLRVVDEIADTLEAIATTTPVNDVRSAIATASAVRVLTSAGQGRSGDPAAPHPGVPYGGALDRLSRIARTAVDVGVRYVALTGLAELPDRARALSRLRDMALSMTGDAADAIEVLVLYGGDDGKRVARRLFTEKVVTEERARRRLEELAAYYRWR